MENKRSGKYVIDLESNNLLSNLLDYSSLPYKLLPIARLWCVVIRDVETDQVWSASNADCTKQWLQNTLEGATTIVLHNGVKFDLVMLKLFGILEYTVSYPKANEITKDSANGTIFGKPVQIVDTLLWSRLFYPDRFGGHSLGSWGKTLGDFKGDFKEFDKYSQEMLDYCIQDTQVTKLVYQKLLHDWNSWSWELAYSMEVKLADLAINREVFGFAFDREKALRCVTDLDQRLSSLQEKVNPILPPKRLNKGEQADYTTPKIQFKKDGTASSFLEKFAAKIGAEVVGRVLKFEGREYELPYHGCVKETLEADISDLDHVKSFLITLGWKPLEWKERDLTKDSKKQPLNAQQREETLARYVEDTLTGVYRDERLDILGCSAERLTTFLKLKLESGKPMKVPTNPCVRVGVEKELCPNLIKLGTKAAFAKDFTEYLTYKHRRSSIAGGKQDEDGEPLTGYLAQAREDGRIPTPAIEIGAATNRYKHIGVANIPRVTSLYGEEMRSLFGCGEGYHQLGFDFASLEARVQGHYIMRYEGGSELADALVAAKPNDIHSIMAKKLGIPRSDAKSVNYMLLYGGSATKAAKMLGISKKAADKFVNDFWDAMPPLRDLKEALGRYYETTGGKQFVLGIDGRKLFARSKHSIINLLFQGGGAILAKWSTVFMMQNMERLGYCICPFDGKPSVINMIDYHDEVQIAVQSGLLPFKTFETEAEGQEHLDDLLVDKYTNSVLNFGKKYYYVPANAVSKAIEDGVESACKLVGLKVDLGIEWSVGLNWQMTH